MVTELSTGLKDAFPDIHSTEAASGTVSIYPSSEEEISMVLAYCNDKNIPLSIEGRGTKSGYGNKAEAYAILSLAKYSGVVEHVPGDMTVTVKAGTRFGELQAYLSQHRQKLAMDPSCPDESTIGGVIASNDSGPKRLGYGTARDSVIGLKMVYPNGRVIRSGGKVVKNVAGYDMNKLFIGSMGTLGVISEITFKLRPLPKSESLLFVYFPSGDMASIKDFTVKILDSMVEPVALELLTPSLAGRILGKEMYTLALSFEDVESSVRYQEEFIKAIVPEGAGFYINRGEEAAAFWRKMEGFVPKGDQAPFDTALVAACMKLGVVNLKAIDVLRECEILSGSGAAAIEAHGGMATGICHAVIRGEAPAVAEAIEQIRKTTEERGGYAVARHLPDSLAGQIDPWGKIPSYFPLLQGIKDKIDPKRILNRKRYIGGI